MGEIGFAISVLELVCTGQVYLPTITFVMGVEEMRRHALSYLLLYNLAFVAPLLVVFALVHWGTTSLQLGGVLLFGLGIWLLLGVV